MPAPTKRAEISLETQIESVELAEEIALRIAADAGFSEEERYRIGMAVREGVINAHNYGNQGSREKRIRMVVELEPEKLVVRIIDEGTGFDPSAVPNPLEEENLLRASGRGIFLMRAFMDEFEIRPSEKGGTELVMAKRLPHAPAA